MTRRVLVTLAIMVAATAAMAQTAALGDLNSTGDADHFESLRLRAGGLLGYKSPLEYAGIAAQDTHYWQSGWKREAPAVMFLWRKQNRETLAGTLAEAGIVRVAGRTRVIGDATWSLRPSARTGFELLAAGDLVETRRALDEATAYTFAGASAERQLTGRFTAIGLGGYQRFTDGNERVHLRGRLIWSLVPEQGLNAQVRWRQYQSRQFDVGGAYFNPQRYRQWDAGLFMRKRHAGWIWYGTIAAGREAIDRDVDRTTGVVEMRAEGPLPNGARLVVHASYNRAAGFAISDRYWYRVAGVTLAVPIRQVP